MCSTDRGRGCYVCCVVVEGFMSEGYLGPLSGGQPGRTGTPDQRREKQVLRDPAGIRVG